MPNALIAVPQKTITVSRWVAESVVKQIIDYTELPNDTIIQFKEKQGHGKQLDTHFKEDEDPIRSRYQNIILCSFTERYTEGDRRRNVLNHIHHKVFNDKDCGAYITPVYAEVEIILELTVRLRDRTALSAWRSRVHLNEGIHRMVQDLVIDYDYELPTDVLAYITDLYKFRNEINGAGIPMRDYINNAFPFGIGVRSNQSKTHTDMIIKERQEGILGSSVDIEFYQDTQDEQGIFEITFPYRFVYQQVQAIRLYTPSVIYNQILPDHWVKAWCNANGPLAFDKDFDPYDSLHDMFYKPAKYALDRHDGGTRMLGWDEWFPKDHFANTRTLTIVPVKVVASAPTAVMNMWDLVDDYLTRDILTYLATYYVNNGEPFTSFVTIEVIEINETETAIEHSIDSLLNLTTANPMDPMRRYMVRVAIRTSLIEIATAHQEAILKDATAIMGVLKTIDVNADKAIKVNPDNTIDDKSYREWIKALPDTLAKYKDGRTYNTRTVGRATITGTQY